MFIENRRKKETITKTEIELCVYIVLYHQGGITLSSLKETFQITMRTIYRYISDIKKCLNPNIPIAVFSSYEISSQEPIRYTLEDDEEILQLQSNDSHIIRLHRLIQMYTDNVERFSDLFYWNEYYDEHEKYPAIPTSSEIIAGCNGASALSNLSTRTIERDLKSIVNAIEFASEYISG